MVCLLIYRNRQLNRTRAPISEATARITVSIGEGIKWAELKDDSQEKLVLCGRSRPSGWKEVQGARAIYKKKVFMLYPPKTKY
jgi:hypothetical protein